MISTHIHPNLRYPVPLPPSISPIQIQIPPKIPQLITIKPSFENKKTTKPSSKNQKISNPTFQSQKTNKPKKIQPEKPKTTTSDVLRLMDTLNLPIPMDIYISLIKECTVTRDPTLSVSLHAHVKRSKLESNRTISNRLLLMYVSCGCLSNARNMFDEMWKRDFNSWCIMISGYIENEDYEEAVFMFVEMLQLQDNESYAVEFDVCSRVLVWMFNALVITDNFELGKELHAWLIKMGYIANLYIASSLISFYGKFNYSKEGDSVFDQMYGHDTVTWTSKVVNACNQERYVDAINIFKEMGKAGIRKNCFTFSSVIKACSRLKYGHYDKQCGNQVHANAIKLGIEKSSVFVRCALIDMYGKHRRIKAAVRVFEGISDDDDRNEACWNAMLMGYVQNGCSVEAVKFLYKMREAMVQVQESLVDEVRIACGGNQAE